MKVIVGLGNPEIKYSKTRHNTGFILLDEIQKNKNLSDFSVFKSSLVSKNSNYILVKPQTYMNLSGIAIKEILNFYKLETSNVLVIYDEANIDIGKYKISLNSGSGGHNGIKNILQEVGNCLKLRVGISNEYKRKQIIGEFVLSNFTSTEYETLKSLSNLTWEIINDFIDDKSPGYLMNKFHIQLS